MNFKSKFMLFNGAYLSIDEVKALYYKALNYNLVTVLIPDEKGNYKPYPSLNFQAKDTDTYYRNSGHAKCFQLINESLKTDNPKYYVHKKFEGIQDRYIIANYFLENKMAIIMSTSKDNFILMFPALSEDKDIRRETCDKILGLIDLLNIQNGWLQVDGIIYEDINDFKEYISLLDSDKKRSR